MTGLRKFVVLCALPISIALSRPTSLTSGKTILTCRDDLSVSFSSVARLKSKISLIHLELVLDYSGRCSGIWPLFNVEQTDGLQHLQWLRKKPLKSLSET